MVTRTSYKRGRKQSPQGSPTRGGGVPKGSSNAPRNASPPSRKRALPLKTINAVVGDTKKRTGRSRKSLATVDATDKIVVDAIISRNTVKSAVARASPVKITASRNSAKGFSTTPTTPTPKKATTATAKNSGTNNSRTSSTTIRSATRRTKSNSAINSRGSKGSTERNASFLSGVRFDDPMLGLEKELVRALHEEFGYEFMSTPQSKIMPVVATTNVDLLAKARTGSGKTLCFALQSLNRILKQSKTSNSVRRTTPSLKSVVLSPSRELAAQTFNEYKRLLKFVPPGSCGVQLITGGTSEKADVSRLKRERTDVLIATPGRLKSLLDSGALDHLMPNDVPLDSFVLDEADRLLDAGFVNEIKRIRAKLRFDPVHTQSLLFSATIPPGVTNVAKLFLNPDKSMYIDTAGTNPPLSGANAFKALNALKNATGRNASNASNVSSIAHIKQSYIATDATKIVGALYAVLDDHVQKHGGDHRVVVFFTNVRLTALYAAFFKASGFDGILEMHSDMSQPQRNRTSAMFGSQRGLIMFASDVVARGLDYPDVSLVVQVGLTTIAQYEHRVGRTGRGGRQGEAVIILGDDEAPALLPELLASKRFVIDKSTIAIPDQLPPRLAAASLSAAGVAPGEDAKRLASVAKRAFASTLGFYATFMKTLKKTPQGIVDMVKSRFKSMGIVALPDVQEKTLRKMHLQGVVI